MPAQFEVAVILLFGFVEAARPTSRFPPLEVIYDLAFLAASVSPEARLGRAS